MEIGSKWHEWTIKELLGTGNFGKVYRIEREEYGYRYVSALKELHIPSHQTDLEAIRNEGMDENSLAAYFQGMIENMLSEMALMSQLKGNSNIVSYEDHEVVKDPDSVGWTVFIRMELLTPLYQFLQNHTMSVRDVIAMGIDLCKALELCQKHHIIHRDIKPENIFYSEQGTFKLGDFGIARELEKTMDGMTRTGTPSYMAPEVFRGKPYSSNVDLYSLGIVLYRFLNQNRTPLLPAWPQPIRYVDRQEANMRRLEGAVLPPPCNASTRLSAIILKACAYAPEDRYESAEDMRRDLEDALEEQEKTVAVSPEPDGLEAADRSTITLAEPEEATEVTVRISEPKSRRPVFAGFLLLLLLVCGLAFGCFRYYHHTVPPVRQMTAEEARNEILDAGLKFQVKKEVYSSSVKKGSVVSPAPSGGETVKKGTTVTVILSKGPKKTKEQEADSSGTDSFESYAGSSKPDSGKKKRIKSPSSDAADLSDDQDDTDSGDDDGTGGENSEDSSGDSSGANEESGGDNGGTQQAPADGSQTESGGSNPSSGDSDTGSQENGSQNTGTETE